LDQEVSGFVELALGDGEVSNGSNSLGIASVQSFLAGLEGTDGGSDFGVSEFGFTGTFHLLSSPEGVVGELFIGDFLLEVV
jgi:hypothetical protein